MNCYASEFKLKHKKGSLLSHVDFHVLFYADNCITRIYSCRDKLSLMVWSYYCPFDSTKKDEVLSYPLILERLKYPIKFGLSIKGCTKFLHCLENLKGIDFSFIENYRHYKIHRREPSIEIYGVKPHHDWPYMIPLFKENDRKQFEEQLKKKYEDDHFRQKILNGCYINGVLFDQRRNIGRLFSYDDVKNNLYSCLIKLMNSSSGCFRVLRNKTPFKKN